MNRNNYNAPRQTDLRVPAASDFGTLAVRSIQSFARQNKVITTSYLFGLLVLLIAGSGTKLTWDQKQEYNRIMDTVDVYAESSASDQYYRSRQRYERTKGWFTCDAICTKHKRKMELDKLQLDEIRKEGQNRMSDAKAVAGLFSEVGVGEVKDSFWEYFASGKNFAKRQSMWDAMFMGMRSMGRDESMLEYAFKVLLQVLLNFSMGLVMALIFFIFGLWSIVKSYQPNPLTAMVFFIAAVCAAFAFVTTYLFALYGTAVGGIYGAAKFAENQMRIQNGAGNGQRRPHYQ